MEWTKRIESARYSPGGEEERFDGVDRNRPRDIRRASAEICAAIIEPNQIFMLPGGNGCERISMKLPWR